MSVRLSRRRARRLALRSDSVDCLALAESLGRQLRSGTTLLDGLERSSRSSTNSWLSQLLDEARRGRSLATVLDDRLVVESRRRRPDADVVLTLQVLALAARVGGEPSRHVDALADTLRSRRWSREERRTHAASALASIRLLTWLPVVCAVWMIADDADIRRLLLSTPIGWTCTALGVAFNLIGRHWTNRMVSSA